MFLCKIFAPVYLSNKQMFYVIMCLEIMHHNAFLYTLQFNRLMVFVSYVFTARDVSYLALSLDLCMYHYSV